MSHANADLCGLTFKWIRKPAGSALGGALALSRVRKGTEIVTTSGSIEK